MKKGKILGFLAIVASLTCGCSCSKIDDTTYENAVNVYKNTDAISFSRIEIIQNEGETSYTRKKTDARYLFNANKQVTGMEHSLTYSDASPNGGSAITKTIKNYYSGERATLYTYSKIGESQLERSKESNVSYDSKFNVNVCDSLDCLNMIVGNFAPIFNLNEVSEFVINDVNGKGEVSFKAVCPSFESCSNSSQIINYNLTIGTDGNIETLSYDIVNGVTTYSIKYTFYGYGSNNVTIEFPSDLESYIEK